MSIEVTLRQVNGWTPFTKHWVDGCSFVREVGERSGEGTPVDVHLKPSVMENEDLAIKI